MGSVRWHGYHGFHRFQSGVSVPACLKKVTLFDCEKAESEAAKGKPTKVNVCPRLLCQGTLRGHRVTEPKIWFSSGFG